MTLLAGFGLGFLAGCGACVYIGARIVRGMFDR